MKRKSTRAQKDKRDLDNGVREAARLIRKHHERGQRMGLRCRRRRGRVHFGNKATTGGISCMLSGLVALRSVHYSWSTTPDWDLEAVSRRFVLYVPCHRAMHRRSLHGAVMHVPIDCKKLGCVWRQWLRCQHCGLGASSWALWSQSIKASPDVLWKPAGCLSLHLNLMPKNLQSTGSGHVEAGVKGEREGQGQNKSERGGETQAWWAKHIRAA